MKTTIQIAALLLCAALLLTACGHTHTYGDWVTVCTATCTEAGEQYRICATCGEMERVTLETTHDYASGVCRACGLRQEETTTTAVATTAPSVTDAPVGGTTTTRGEGVIPAAETTSTTMVPLAPDENPQWTVTEAQEAAQAARRAVEAMRDAKNSFREACNTTDRTRKLQYIQTAQEQVQTARAHLLTVSGYCANNASIALSGGAYDTAADCAYGILVRCNALTATSVTIANCTTLDVTLMADAVSVMSECLTLQSHLTDWLNCLMD